MSFGERLRQARMERDMSQGRLAGRAGLQPSAISRFETGGALPSFLNLSRLSTALGVTVDYLCCRAELPDLDNTLARQIQMLTVDDRRLVEKIVWRLSSTAENCS